eukprot:7385417-Prymnesium_polylepis.1
MEAVLRTEIGRQRHAREPQQTAGSSTAQRDAHADTRHARGGRGLPTFLRLAVANRTLEPQAHGSGTVAESHPKGAAGETHAEVEGNGIGSANAAHARSAPRPRCVDWIYHVADLRSRSTFSPLETTATRAIASEQADGSEPQITESEHAFGQPRIEEANKLRRLRGANLSTSRRQTGQCLDATRPAKM